MTNTTWASCAPTLQGAPLEIDPAAWWAPLRAAWTDLNIEGAFVDGAALRLLQRANQGQARNVCIGFDLAQVARWIVQGGGLPPAPVDTGGLRSC